MFSVDVINTNSLTYIVGFNDYRQCLEQYLCILRFTHVSYKKNITDFF